MNRRARVKVTSSVVTRREAAAEFGRKKARQRRKQTHRRIAIVGGGLLALYLVVGGWWLVHNGTLEQSLIRSNERFWQMTARAGFTLDQVVLTGRAHADANAVKAAIGAKQGAPILAMPLADIKARLEKIPEVKTVQVARALPNVLQVQITERVPAAFWQQEGVLSLVDAQGVVLPRQHYQKTGKLPVVIGADAPAHMPELMALLDTVPSLKTDVTAAIRVGSRRWNIQLSRDIVVMLPEENPAAAWKRFAGLVEHKALLSKAIRSVDMRIEDRVFIMPIEQTKSPIILTNARDI